MKSQIDSRAVPVVVVIAAAAWLSACAATGLADPEQESAESAASAPKLAISGLTASPAVVGRPRAGDAAIVQLSFSYSQGAWPIRELEVTTLDLDGTARVDRYGGVRRFDIVASQGTGRFPVVYDATTPVGKRQYQLRLIDASGAGSSQASASVTVDTGAAPLVAGGFSPASGAPGASVVIDATGLVAGELPRVLFAGVAAEVLDASASKITAKVPAGATPGPIAVRATRGVSVTLGAFKVLPSVELSVATTQIAAGRKLAIAPRVHGLADAALIWQVNGIAGGSAAVGTIASDGSYAAPVSAVGDVVVKAIAKADSAVSAAVTLRVVPPPPIDGHGGLRAATGGTLTDELGYVQLSVPAGGFAADPVLTAKAGMIAVNPGDGAAGDEPLAWFSIADDKQQALAKAADVRILLPRELPSKTQLSVVRNDAARTAAGTVQVDGTQLTAVGKLAALGDFIVVRHTGTFDGTPPGVPTAPPTITDVAAPPDVTMDEGMTQPIRIQGSNFWVGHTAVSVADIRTQIGSGPPAVVADAARRKRLIASLVFGAVVVDPTGSRLGVTLRSLPTGDLEAGELLWVSFRISRLSVWGLPLSWVDSAWTAFSLRGLRELIVDQHALNEIWTIDGQKIDALIDSRDTVAHRYSTLVVNEAMTLGVGRAVTSATIAAQVVDLSTVRKFEAVYGTLDWVDQRLDQATFRDTAKLFQPDRAAVGLDVTGPVKIYGSVYLGGMHGGENANLRQAAGSARPGGLFGDHPAGGLGGNGGVVVNNQTTDGQPAGGGFPDDGVGASPSGPLPTAVAAGGGSRFDPGNVSYEDFVDSLVGAGALAVGFAIAPPSVLVGLAQAAAQAAKIGGAYSDLATPVCVTCQGGAGAQFLGGRGGHGGLRPSGLGVQLPIDTDLRPGSGGGGGGGGGSSAYREDLFGITLSSFEGIGGGGAGGGGAAGALRITTSSLFRIYNGGGFVGAGGRGGLGEPHRWIASPGGGGGGGAGAVVKLQGYRLVDEGVVDASAGARGGAVIAQSRHHLPFFKAQVHAFDGGQRGGLLYWERDTAPATLAFVTGRLRAATPDLGIGRIRAIGNAYPFGLPLRAMWVVDDNRHLGVIGLPDFDLGTFSTVATTPVSLLGVIPSGEQITDVVQSSQPPYNIYLSTVEGSSPYVIEEAICHVSRIHEISTSIVYQREVYSGTTCGYNDAVGQLKAIDFLSDGRLAALMAVVAGSTVESGVHAIDIQTGSRSLLFYYGAAGVSMAVMRGPRDQVLIAHSSPTVARDSGFPPAPQAVGYDQYLIRLWTDGEETGVSTLALETTGGTGEPGMVRLDGALPGANAPVIALDGEPLRNLIYQGLRASYAQATLGSLVAPATALGMETQVFSIAAQTAYAQGAEPGAVSKLCKKTPASTACSPMAAAASDGQAQVAVSLSAGFNTLWTETTVGGDAHDLLRRRVLLIQ